MIDLLAGIVCSSSSMFSFDICLVLVEHCKRFYPHFIDVKKSTEKLKFSTFMSSDLLPGSTF